ncbi:YrdB family protein [Streptomyces fagopyri]|uniref:YrdB family protein n=1 Tax=Streptomyces fagopyri TaxID=2662397 RepID=UPI003692CF60
MKVIKAANLGVLFLLELATLVAAAYGGFGGERTAPVTWLLGIGGPAVLIALWALFGSPKSRYKTRGAVRVGFELLWFGAGVAALAVVGAAGWAVALAVVCAVSKTLAAVWHQ